MNDYEQISDEFWNRKSKGKEELLRERLFMDDFIQKSHLRREIEQYLPGVKTVLDAGAGSGRFSIPLAARGLKVTHYDISDSMIEAARAEAEKAGATGNMTFVKGKLSELRQYKDHSFDLVLCFDSPVSYCYPNHHEMIAELARVAGKALVISVSSRYGFVPYMLNPFQKVQFLFDEKDPDPINQWYAQSSQQSLEAWEPDWAVLDKIMSEGLEGNPGDILAEFQKGHRPWPVNYLFTPEELQADFKKAGVKDIRLSGPCAYARTLPREILRKLLGSKEHCARFLDFCYKYDSLPWVLGLGKDNLVASGRTGKS